MLMQTVVLAGGVGRRVFPLSSDEPKCMFKLLGKPLIGYVIDTLKASGLKDFVVVTGQNGTPIKGYLGDGKRLNVKVRWGLQKQPLGMANALESVEDLLEDSFFVINADDIFESRLIKEIIAKTREHEADILLSCKPAEETWKFGIVRKEGDRVTRLVEKPPRGKEPSNLAVMGVYYVTKEILRYFHRVEASDHQYEDAIQTYINDKRIVKAVAYDGFFAGYKHPWDLFSINAYLMDKFLTKRAIAEDVKISDRSKIEGNVCINSGCKILEGACIRGPVYVGPDTIVGNNCLIRDYSSIGANCTVGFSSEIKRSLIGDNCLFHMNFVGDSIISDDCMFGAGSTTANLRFDGRTVVVDVDGQKFDSGEEKLGVIMGANCRTGINSCLAPGVKVGPRSIVGPGVLLQRDLGEGMAAFSKKEGYVVRPNKLIFRGKEESRS